MRIYFSSMDLPKKAAKRIQKHFTPDHDLFEPMKLSHAQFLAANMLGYEDWHELNKITKSGLHTPSILDEFASAEEQLERVQYQVDQLGRFQPQTEPIIKEMVLKFRVSAGNPLSEGFLEDGYRKNALFYWEPWGGKPEWRFRQSARSMERRDELYEISTLPQRNQINVADYINLLTPYITAHPENIVPYLYIITTLADVNDWAATLPYLDNLETVIKNCIPPAYPLNKKVPALIWGTIDNRDYLRCIYWLGVGYYANGNYKKAKQWFLFLTRCCEVELGNEKEFLRDLRSESPEGDIHLN